MFVSPAFAAAASVVALNTVIAPTLMFASPMLAAADSVVLMLATLATLMFVSPANAALAPPLAQAGVDSEQASVVSPVTSPVFPLPGSELAFMFVVGGANHV